MAPTLSASGSVGEGRVEGSGGERRGCGRTPLSRGECGRRGQQEREIQGLPRPSGLRFAVYMAKNRRDDAQRSAGWFVISYFSNVKQLTREREKCWHHWCMLTSLLAPAFFRLCNHQGRKITVAWIKDCAMFGNLDNRPTGQHGWKLVS